MNIASLRKKYPEFTYKKFNWEVSKNNLIIKYDFRVNNAYKFSPSLVYKKINSKFVTSNKKAINNLVFNIGMVELLSYWKAFLSPKIIIECGFLDDYQNKWWSDLLINGMGQFFYENKIDFTGEDFIQFISKGKKETLESPISVISDTLLVASGGGKDSTVTIEILSKNFKNLTGFLVNPSNATKKVSKLSQTPSLIIERHLDEKLFELNTEGFLNGHTPFTALLSFTGILGAVLGKHGSLIFSNERSSDEENTTYLGMNINHQYSKTLEFENKFIEYNKRYLSNVNYFSFLRPLYDIQIAKIFSGFNKYFSVIRSCNVGQKAGTWCGKCPKCLSTFILFYPFLKEKTITVFGKNLLEDESLKPLLKLLTGDEEVKPFECVGTKEELRVALGTSSNKRILRSWNSKNNVPAFYQKVLRRYLHKGYMKRKLNKIFKNKKIVILGTGREGESTLKFIKKFYPLVKVETRDQKDGENYLNDLQSFDLIIKSPGISWNKPEIKKAREAGVLFTSQTQIFLDLFNSRTIGVTGTKGKSTTSALIYHILLSAKKKAKLVGNIGRPVLDYLEDEDSDTIFVYEMSSHQLSDLKVSPHVAVFLNIYPEHLDYYSSFEEYFQAKANITKFQERGDVFVYSSDFQEIEKIAKLSKATALSYCSKDNLDKLGITRLKAPLLGSHNLNNIKAAVLTAQNIGISNLVIKKSIQTFIPLEGRLEKVGVYKSVTFVCDTLSTIPESAVAAINSFSGIKITLILGGFDRGLNFDILANAICLNNNVENIILIGNTAQKIKTALIKYNYQGVIIDLGKSTMDLIVKSSFDVTSEQGLVLLSPASTSFDMFKDYQDRADQFVKAFMDLSMLK